MHGTSSLSHSGSFKNVADGTVEAMIVGHFPRGQLIGLSLPAASLFWSPIGRQTKQSVGADWACTLDLALVIGHGLFDWDKVITCYLFRHCPLQSAACTQTNISPLCIKILQIVWIMLYLKYECIRNCSQCLCRWWKQIIFLSLRAF